MSDVDLALGHVDSLSQKGDVALVIHLQEKQCNDSKDKTKMTTTKTIALGKFNYKDKKVDLVIHLEERQCRQATPREVIL